MVKAATGAPRRMLRRAFLTAGGAAAGLLLLAALAIPTWAAESVDTAAYEVQETYTITVNDVGDAHFEDVMKYDEEFFAAALPYLQKYPELLSRRYERQVAVQEIQNFQSRLDADKATVTLTFDQPGYAYNEGDHWMLPFFSSPPDGDQDGVPTFEETSTVSNEYTLFEDAAFITVTRVQLPPGAGDARWDEHDEALLYALAYEPPTSGNVLQRNSTAFTIVFAVLMALSLGAAALLLLRKPAPGAAPGAPGPESPGPPH